jgi:hypothetical protein
MQGSDGDGKRERQAHYVTWLGIGGALLIIVVSAVVMNWRSQAELNQPEALTMAPSNLVFTGASLQGDAKNAVAVRLRNFMVACAEGNFQVAESYIDPQSFLAGNTSAACGPVATALAHNNATMVKFERVATDNSVSSVYISTQQPQSVKESYIFFMRKVKGKWYFSAP